MILAIDLGNTTISLAMVGRGGILQLGKMDTVLAPAVFKRKLRAILSKSRKSSAAISSIVICSVVPGATPTLVSFLKKEFRQRILVVGRDIKVPMANRYRGF